MTKDFYTLEYLFFNQSKMLSQQTQTRGVPEFGIITQLKEDLWQAFYLCKIIIPLLRAKIVI